MNTGPSHLDVQRVADEHRPEEAQFLADVGEAGAGQLRVGGRHESAGQQAVHDAPLERRAAREVVVHVQRVQVARQLAEGVDVGRADRARDGMLAADRHVVEGQQVQRRGIHRAPSA
jgi:hypothetical protein